MKKAIYEVTVKCETHSNVMENRIFERNKQ